MSGAAFDTGTPARLAFALRYGSDALAWALAWMRHGRGDSRPATVVVSDLLVAWEGGEA